MTSLEQLDAMFINLEQVKDASDEPQYLHENADLGTLSTVFYVCGTLQASGTKQQQVNEST